MLDAFRWLLAVEIIGLAAFPLIYYLLPRLADRGYAFSKPFGILLTAYLFWALGMAQIPTVRATAIALVVVMAAASAFYVYRNIDEFKRFLQREWRTIAIAEALFVAFFVGWALFRASDPFINHTEQPMDLALLSASVNSQFGHPEDPWLRGEPISYYYFGYWMMGMLSRLADVPTNISYNLSMALIPAMAAAGAFGIVLNMARAECARRRSAIIAGIAAAMLLGVVSNLEGVLEFMRLNGMGSQGFWDWIRIEGLTGANEMPPQSWAPSEHWWWFRASRVINTFDGSYFIDNTIQEFPFFSFILGDMHPHVMSIPFVALFIGIVLNLSRLPSDFWRSYRNPYAYAVIGAAALALGGLGFNNLWDMPTFAALLIGALALKAYRDGADLGAAAARALFPVGVIAFALALLLYSPYLLNINAGVEGIGVVITPTRPVHMFIVWGLFLTAIVPFLLITFWRTTVQRDWKARTVAALALGFAPWALWTLAYLPNEGSAGEVASRLFAILPLGIYAALAAYNAIWLARRPDSAGKLYATLLILLGLGLIIGSEFLFIRDFFNNRGNTVFKLYYQAWILLAAASAFVIYYWLTTIKNLAGWRSTLSILWAAAFVALLTGSLYYTIAAPKTKPDSPPYGSTLDGLSYLRISAPAEYEAIAYLKRQAPNDAAIVEAVGEWHDWAMISRATGLPTIVNWLGHQKQWRGGWNIFDAPTPDESRQLRDQYFNDRAAEVALIYTTTDAVQAQAILRKYDIDYVYIGRRERESYGSEGLAKFNAFADVVFSSGEGANEAVIYRIR